MWEKLFAYVSETAQAWGEAFAYWRGHRVVLLDGTCVSMPDEPALFETFGVNTGYHGQGRYPLARVATLCLAGTMTVIAYALGGYWQSEWALALTILGTLRKGDLLIADRYFAAAHYYWQYQSLGLEFLTRTHQRLIVSRIKRVQSYSRNDFLGWLTINKSYRKKDPHASRASAGAICPGDRSYPGQASGDLAGHVLAGCQGVSGRRDRATVRPTLEN